MNTAPIKLIVGLGNPGDKYMKTRHNAGFLFLDELCRQTQCSLAVEKNCFGRTAKTMIADREVRLLAPDTFMNLSGKSVVACMSYYKIDMHEMLVVHDELDLDAGVARLKLSGGHGGNNGVRDVITQTGSRDFARLRIGIGHPGVGKDVSGYVLKQPNKADSQKIENAIKNSLNVMPLVVSGEFEKAMNQLHTNN